MEQLKVIERETFSGTPIPKISIPNNVTCIADYAFDGCQFLQFIDIQYKSRLKIIGRSAFDHTRISFLYLPSCVTEIRDGWCSYINLRLFMFSPEQNFRNERQFLLGKSDIESDNYDVLLFAQKSFEIITIPPTIKKIASFSFQKSKIKRISIPPNVNHIGKSAFDLCTNLRYVDIPENSALEMIEPYSFSFSSIESIFIPKHVKFLYRDTFDYCKHLQIIEIDENSELIRLETDCFEKTIIMIPAQLKDKIEFNRLRVK